MYGTGTPGYNNGIPGDTLVFQVKCIPEALKKNSFELPFELDRY